MNNPTLLNLTQTNIDGILDFANLCTRFSKLNGHDVNHFKPTLSKVTSSRLMLLDDIDDYIKYFADVLNLYDFHITKDFVHCTWKKGAYKMQLAIARID